MLRHLLQLFLDLHPTDLPPCPALGVPRGPEEPDPRRSPPLTGAPSTWARVGSAPGCAPRPPPPAAASPLFRPVRVERARPATPPPEPPTRPFGTCGGRTVAPAVDLDARTLPVCDTRPTCSRWRERGPGACHVCTDWKA